MSNIDDKLNEVLNIAEEVLDKKEEKNPLEIVNEKPVPAVVPQADVDTDFDTGRGELYKLLEKGFFSSFLSSTSSAMFKTSFNLSSILLIKIYCKDISIWSNRIKCNHKKSICRSI